MNANTSPSPEEKSARRVLRAIHEGKLGPETLAPEDRQACVEQLSIEGYSTSEIAEILKVGDRTIRRDFEAIRERHAIERDPNMVKIVVGQLSQQAQSSIERIHRTLRVQRSTTADCIFGEHTCWKIQKEYVETLQRLGYLPTADLKIRSDVTHHLEGELPDLAQLQEQLLRLEAIEQENGGDLACIEMLKVDLSRVQIACQIEDLTRKVNKEENQDEQTETA